MADIKRIKSNIEIMINKGASEEEIDSYISQEGVSLEQLRGSDRGFGSIGERLIQFSFNPMAKTITGKSLQQMSLDSPIPADYPLEGEPKALYYPRAMITGMMRDIPAYAADTMTTPANLLTAGLAKIPMGVDSLGKGVNLGQKVMNTKAAQGFANFLTKERHPIKNAIDFIRKPSIIKESAEAAKFGYQQKANLAISEASKKAESLISKKEIELKNIQESYDDLSNSLKQQLTKDADSAGLNARENIVDLIRKKSSEYGSKLSKLVGNKNIAINADDVVSGMENTLIKQGVLRFDEKGNLIVARTPRTGAEETVYGLYKGTKGSLADNPGAKIDIQDLLRIKNQFSPKIGKKWDSNDLLMSNFIDDVTEKIDDAVPGLAELRSSYAPYAKLKNEAIKKFQPFESKYETGRVTSILKKAGEKKLDPDEMRFINDLNSSLGKRIDAEVGRTGAKIRSAEKRLKAINESSELVIKQIKKDVADEIAKIKTSRDLNIRDVDIVTEKLLKDYHKKKVMAGVAGAIGLLALMKNSNSLKYFVRREVYSLINY